MSKGKKRPLLKGHHVVCPQTKEWSTKPLKKNDDWSTKDPKGHTTITNKGEKLRQLPPYSPKFMENGLTQDSVESIYNVNLKQHPIKMGIQNGSNTMDYSLTTFLTTTPNWYGTNEKQMHHETIDIKLCPLVNKMSFPLQSNECHYKV